jgi:adenylyltransferase/sulfurtransferase
MKIETYDFFSRQIPYLGVKKQEKLGKAKAVVVGAGGLGSHVSEMLIRMGFGYVRVIDRDLVDETNLHRTSLYTREDIGKSKVFVISEKLKDLNPETRIEGITETLHIYNAEKLVSDFDVVLDCTDNMETRYAINRFCIKNKIPWIYGAVLRDEGFSSTFSPEGRPCFACLYPEMPRTMETCAQVGVIPTIIGIIASWQVTEALKIVTGLGKIRYGQLFHVSLERPLFEFLKIKPREDCEVCRT